MFSLAQTDFSETPADGEMVNLPKLSGMDQLDSQKKRFSAILDPMACKETTLQATFVFEVTDCVQNHSLDSNVL